MMFLSIHGKINDAAENAHTHTHKHTDAEMGGCGAALEADAKWANLLGALPAPAPASRR